MTNRKPYRIIDLTGFLQLGTLEQLDEHTFAFYRAEAGTGHPIFDSNYILSMQEAVGPIFDRLGIPEEKAEETFEAVTDLISDKLMDNLVHIVSPDQSYGPRD